LARKRTVAAPSKTVRKGKSVQDLLDVRLPPEEEAMIRRKISEHGPSIKAIRGIRTRKAGSTRFMEPTILVDSEMTVAESHRVTDDIARGIQEHYREIMVTVHVEPWKAPQSRHAGDREVKN
jgi:ferrous-iron efflux pump FieF